MSSSIYDYYGQCIFFGMAINEEIIELSSDENLHIQFTEISRDKF